MDGVNVVEYAEKKPCRIWEADEWHCPVCNNKVVIRFSRTAINSWDERFKDALFYVMSVVNQDKLREVFERPLKEDDQDDDMCIGQGEPPDVYQGLPGEDEKDI
jgi:hypothetical protein